MKYHGIIFYNYINLLFKMVLKFIFMLITKINKKNIIDFFLFCNKLKKCKNVPILTRKLYIILLMELVNYP